MLDIFQSYLKQLWVDESHTPQPLWSEKILQTNSANKSAIHYHFFKIGYLNPRTWYSSHRSCPLTIPWFDLGFDLEFHNKLRVTTKLHFFVCFDKNPRRKKWRFSRPKWRCVCQSGALNKFNALSGTFEGEIRSVFWRAENIGQDLFVSNINALLPQRTNLQPINNWLYAW